MNKNGWLMLFALAAASSVSAQTATPPAAQPPADYAARFKAADRDGTVDLNEVKAAMGKPQGPMMGTPPPQPAPATKP